MPNPDPNPTQRLQQANPDPGATPPKPTGPARGASKPWLAGVIAAGLFLAIALPLILSGFHEGRASWDSRHYHEPAVRLFAEQWPKPDLSDYASATTPGYHLLLAQVVRAGLDSSTQLRLASAAITGLLAFVLAWTLARRTSLGLGVLLTLPLIASNYTLLPGVFVLPDNLAWLLVLTVLLLAQQSRQTLSVQLCSGLVLVLLVATRQIHLWAAAPLVVAAFLHADPCVTKPVWQEWSRRVLPTLRMGLLTLPAVACVAWFVQLWGGLTPPRFQSEIQSFSPSLPAFVLLEIAILSVFFLPWLWPTVRQLRSPWHPVLWLAAAAGVVVAAVPETTWSFEDGRASGWWNLIRVVPEIAEHTSPILLMGAPVGAVLVTLWGMALPVRARWILGFALLGFAASQTASANVWQRYHEPLLLLLMALSVAAIAAREPETPAQSPTRRLRSARIVGLLGLSAFLALFTVRALLAGDIRPGKAGPTEFGVVEEAPDPPPSPDNARESGQPEP